MTVNPQNANMPGFDSSGFPLVTGQSIDSVTGKPVPNESVNRAASVTVQNTDSWKWPETWRLDIPTTTDASALDNTILYESPDVSEYNVHYIECLTGTIDVDVSLDGINFTTTDVQKVAIELINDTTAGGTKSLLLSSTNGIGIIKGKYKKIRVRQVAATQANIRGFHGVD